MNKTPARPREMAFRLALQFPAYIPTPKQVMFAFPMIDRATAYRYITAYRNARRAA